MQGFGPDMTVDAATLQAGDLVIDLGRQRVERAGVLIELPRLSFDLLVALVRAAPNIVSNEELMSSTWKGLVVSPETVTQRVKLLRDALGDDPKQPRYVEGLRGRGYRMIPEVRALAPATLTQGTLPGSLPIVERAPGIRWVWVLAGITAALLIGWSLLLSNRNASTSTSASAPGPATESDRTIAVLPFVTSPQSTIRGELVVGLTDSVNARLEDVRGLNVISGYSSKQFDAASLDPHETGRVLGARYLVLGSMQTSGNLTRVIAKIVDTSSGALLWTQQFDRAPDDLFGMQDAVALGVAQALQSRIAGIDPKIPVGERSPNLEAYLAYLRGRSLLGRTTIIGSIAAEQEFQRASELDPTFVPAQMGIYDSRMQATSLRRTGMGKALADNAALLEKARALQPDSGAIDIAEAMWGKQPDAARAALFEKGLARDRANVRAMTAYSELLDQMNQRAAADQWLQRALLIDPLWPRARFRAAQRNFSNVGAAVEQQNLKTLELDPNYYPALQRRAKYQWQQHGEIAQAILVIERAIASDPENPWGLHTAIPFYLDLNQPGKAEELARRNAVAAASTRALRAQYAGDWRAAGEAAFAEGSFVFGASERWGVPAALRDYALHTRETGKVIEALSSRYDLPLDREWKLTPFNFREGQLLAHVLLMQGKRKEAMRRLDSVITWIDANAFMGPIYNLRTKAQALQLKGETDAALKLLDQSFQENDYTQWWYTLRLDPTWDGLRNDPRFIAIIDAVRTHIGMEAAQLDKLQHDSAPAPATATATATARSTGS
jgi:TolB-like protein/DNA-binding winged helix-turn-helix (wHTH) protein